MPSSDSVPPPLLTMESVGLRWPTGVEALAGVDLQMPAGQFAAIVGPSGCGKSTLLRLVAGLLRPTAGGATLGGDPIGRHPERHPCGMVFQTPSLLPWLTVEKNIRVPLALEGQDNGEGRARVSELLRMVGLEEFARAYPNQLSGGMKMRVALARGLVTRPQILLMDEPFGALDEINRQRLNEELAALWQRERPTILFVTHSVTEAAFMAERVLVMTPRPGRLAADLPVPFAYPRLAPLRAEPDFARFGGAVSAALASAMEEERKTAAKGGDLP